ncbi:hypothetical protein F4804DRAFT_74702 [Jackrogersella minutella]|nr:hypothetical protein F4804DRAFT_74702 [Jackrogersella minutella]
MCCTSLAAPLWLHLFGCTWSWHVPDMPIRSTKQIPSLPLLSLSRPIYVCRCHSFAYIQNYLGQPYLGTYTYRIAYLIQETGFTEYRFLYTQLLQYS